MSKSNTRSKFNNNRNNKSSGKKIRKIVSNELNESEHRQITTSIPSDIVPNRKISYVRRYVTASTFNSDLTIAQLFSTCIMAVTSTSGYSPFIAIRLKKVNLWSPVTTIGTPVTNSLTPFQVETDINSFSDLPTTFVATSGTIEKLAANGLVPKKTHPSGSWHQSTAVSASLVRIKCPAGSILQLELEGVIRTSGNTAGYVAAVVGAVPGTMYCVAIATNFIPVEVNAL